MSNDFSGSLISWYRQKGRDLPWRHTSDPYVIWISEVMLQQTQVSQSYDYFIRFTKRFPDVRSLAAASEDEVLHYWQGLGYYSRARNLHAAARQIVGRGAFPDQYEDIRSLKGVGDYTAAAVASFAFGRHCAVVDGNVYRVLSRYFGISDPIDTVKGKKYFKTLAQELLPDENEADYNQAIMDFGAMQCVPRNPDCGNCPLSEGCMAYAHGQVQAFPVKSRKVHVETRYLYYFWLRSGDQIALFRREGRGIWRGLYEPFLVEGDESEDSWRKDKVLSGLTAQPGSRLAMLAGNVRHQLTHRLLVCTFFVLDLPETPDSDKLGRMPVWTNRHLLADYAMPQLMVRLLSECNL